MASDTAISSIMDGKRVRLSNSAEKIFRKNNDIIFCSGNMDIANKCKKYIKQLETLDIEKVRIFASSLFINGMFEIFIAKTDGDYIKSYQLSSYNNFKPIKRVVNSGATEIFAIGYNTQQMLNSFEKHLKKTDVISAIRNSFEDNISIEVGGNVEIIYYYKKNICQKNFVLPDANSCLMSFIDSKDCELIVADSLAGKILLGDTLYIGNEDNTFVIKPNGLSLYDQSSSHEERIFLGLEKVDGVTKARLRLHSANDSNRLVLSEDGMYQVIPFSGCDNFDSDNHFLLNFYLDQNISRIDSFNVRFMLSNFRGYTRGASTTKTSTTLTTTKSAGGSNYTSTSKSTTQKIKATSKASTDIPSRFATSLPALIDGSVEENTANFLVYHQHYIDDTAWLNHTHEIETQTEAHNHTFELPNHDHEIDLIIDGHTHEMEYGIFEFAAAPSVDIYLDSTLIKSNVSGGVDLDLKSKLSLTKGWHTIKVVGRTSTKNPLGLGRVQVDAQLGAFVSF